jgi:hypothetical protein
MSQGERSLADPIADHWVIVEPGVIMLPTTGYQIRRNASGSYQAYHGDAKIGPSWPDLPSVKSMVVRPHLRDLLAVGVEP